MKSLSPIKIVATIAVAAPLFLLCQAAGIHQGWITTAVIGAGSIGVGNLAAALCNPNRGARPIDRVKDRQTEDFLANLERGRSRSPRPRPADRRPRLCP